MKQYRAEHLNIGALGEEIACKFLMKHGFSIVGRNFRQKCGEIDVIAIKSAKLHFIEVKSVSRENFADVPHETQHYHRPEEGMHQKKIDRLEKTVQLYLLKHNVPHETEFQLDGITVVLDHINRAAHIHHIKHINV